MLQDNHESNPIASIKSKLSEFDRLQKEKATTLKNIVKYRDFISFWKNKVEAALEKYDPHTKDILSENSTANNETNQSSVASSPLSSLSALSDSSDGEVTTHVETTDAGADNDDSNSLEINASTLVCKGGQLVNPCSGHKPSYTLYIPKTCNRFDVVTLSTQYLVVFDSKLVLVIDYRQDENSQIRAISKQSFNLLIGVHWFQNSQTIVALNKNDNEKLEIYILNANDTESGWRHLETDQEISANTSPQSEGFNQNERVVILDGETKTVLILDNENSLVNLKLNDQFTSIDNISKLKLHSNDAMGSEGNDTIDIQLIPVSGSSVHFVLRIGDQLELWNGKDMRIERSAKLDDIDSKYELEHTSLRHAFSIPCTQNEPGDKYELPDAVICLAFTCASCVIYSVFGNGCLYEIQSFANPKGMSPIALTKELSCYTSLDRSNIVVLDTTTGETVYTLESRGPIDSVSVHENGTICACSNQKRQGQLQLDLLSIRTSSL